MNDESSRRRFIINGVLAGASVAIRAFSPLRAVDASLTSGSPARQHSQLAELERLVNDLMRQNAVPGLSIAVIRDAKVVWHRALGVRDLATRAPVDERTLFEAASVSKPVFACAVMQLVDRGVLALDTPLTKYTPVRILTGDPRLDLITARHILSHTSGLPNHRSGDDPLRIHFTPGEKFEYSGEGYWYLQSVITHLLGKVDTRTCAEFEAGLSQCSTDFGSYMKANVLVPYGMPTSTYEWSDAIERRVALRHDTAGKELPTPKPNGVEAGRYGAMGGLRTTALELSNFLIEVMAPRASSRFRLSSAARREMVRPHVTIDAAKSWALGWEVNRTPNGTLIRHQGGHPGVQAFAAASIEKRSGYAILTNSENGWKVFYDDKFVALSHRILLG